MSILAALANVGVGAEPFFRQKKALVFLTYFCSMGPGHWGVAHPYLRIHLGTGHEEKWLVSIWKRWIVSCIFMYHAKCKRYLLVDTARVCIQREAWCMGLLFSSVDSRVDSNTCTMVNPMAESALTLCMSRLYPPVRDQEFGLRKSPQARYCLAIPALSVTQRSAKKPGKWHWWNAVTTCSKE